MMDALTILAWFSPGLASLLLTLMGPSLYRGGTFARALTEQIRMLGLEDVEDRIRSLAPEGIDTGQVKKLQLDGVESKVRALSEYRVDVTSVVAGTAILFMSILRFFLMNHFVNQALLVVISGAAFAAAFILLTSVVPEVNAADYMEKVENGPRPSKSYFGRLRENTRSQMFFLRVVIVVITIGLDVSTWMLGGLQSPGAATGP